MRTSWCSINVRSDRGQPPSALPDDKAEKHVSKWGRGGRTCGGLVERAFRQELAGLDDADAVDQPLGDVEHIVVASPCSPCARDPTEYP